MDSMLMTRKPNGDVIELGHLVRVDRHISGWNGKATVIFIDFDPEHAEVWVTVRMLTGQFKGRIGSFVVNRNGSALSPIDFDD